MQKHEKTWLAAIIDGEGSIFPSYCGSKYCKRPHYRLYIGNVSYALVHRAADLIGSGKVAKRFMPRTNKQPLYQYALSDGRVLHAVLDQVLPFLIVKKKLAQKVLKYLEARGLASH